MADETDLPTPDELTDIEAIEDRFIEKLTEVMPRGTAIFSFPTGTQEYEVAAAAGCCLIRYQGSTYSEPTFTGGQTQDIEFMIACGALSLRGPKQKPHQGAYRLLRIARKALIGFEVVRSEAKTAVFYPSQDGFLEAFDGIWWYELRVKAKNVKV